MGVPKFYRWISERYPCLSEVLKEYQLPEFDNLYLDMNGIIHNCSHPEDDNVYFRITEEKIFQDIFHYIEVLFRIIKPKKVFFMAVDGVAPRAKMNQQRGRRFRSAREAELMIKDAVAKGEILPTEDRFDSNCITPGTEFMTKLHSALQYFIVDKISNDTLWQKPRIILSGHETPGEGEHKIMDFIRHERSGSDYDPDTRHCLYGLDADLIMLGLTSHEPKFSLLREEVKFTGKAAQKKSSAPEDTTFHLLHLSLMREYLDYEFAVLKDKLSFGYNLENIIDDWVLMGFLVGNDFIPHLPYLHIHQDCLPLLWRTYMTILPSLDGYLNEGGIINLARLEKYLVLLSRNDIEKFQEIYEDIQFLKGKQKLMEPFDDTFDEKDIFNEIGAIDSSLAGIPTATEYVKGQESAVDIPGVEEEIFNTDKEAFINRVIDESSEETDPMLIEFTKFKRNYYMEKLDYIYVDKDVLESQAHGYVKALQWILHYYYNGVQSWSWYYPYHYAPYLSDVKNFSHLKIEFDMGVPFFPFEQLMAVLPAASKKLLPKPYQRLMVDEDSPVIDYYPIDFETDLNGKQQSWEAVVLIPFIDEVRLLKAMQPLSVELSKDEIIRNQHGPQLLFTYSVESLGTFAVPSFPTVPNNHSKMVKLQPNFFVLPIPSIVKGLSPGVDPTSYHLGFPYLRHFPHRAGLRVGGVRVFQQQSRNENMILTLLPDTKTLDDAISLIGSSIYVGWPHLYEAFVVEVSTDKYRYLIREGSRKVEKIIMSMGDSECWHKEAHSVTHKYYERYGIETGEAKVLIKAKSLNGKRYVCEKNGIVQLQKQWNKLTTSFVFQACLPKLSIKCLNETEITSADQLFEKDSTVFLIANPHYGCQGKVLELTEKTDIRVKVKFTTPVEPDLTSVKQHFQADSDQYYPAYVMGQMLGISSNIVSRITGTVLMERGGENNKRNSLNFGLNLKFNKTGREVPGYSKKIFNDWNYSIRVKEILDMYMDRFPEVFQAIGTSNHSDVYLAENVFKKDKETKMLELKEFLNDLPSLKVGNVPHGSKIVDETCVTFLVDLLNKHQKLELKPALVKLNVRPQVLFRPMEKQFSLIADQSVTFEIFDRVVNIREGYSVPLGLRGTVIGICNDTVEQDITYEVLFDHEFVGGLTIRCPPNRAYRLPCSAILNITHGSRLIKKPKTSLGKTMLQKQLLLDKKSNEIIPIIGNNTSLSKATYNKESINKIQPGTSTIPLGGFRFPHPPTIQPPNMPQVTAEDEEEIITQSNFDCVWQDLQKIKNQVVSGNMNDKTTPYKSEPRTEKLENKPPSRNYGIRVDVDSLFRSSREKASIAALTNATSVSQGPVSVRNSEPYSAPLFKTPEKAGENILEVLLAKKGNNSIGADMSSGRAFEPMPNNGVSVAYTLSAGTHHAINAPVRYPMCASQLPIQLPMPYPVCAATSGSAPVMDARGSYAEGPVSVDAYAESYSRVRGKTSVCPSYANMGLGQPQFGGATSSRFANANAALTHNNSNFDYLNRAQTRQSAAAIGRLDDQSNSYTAAIGRFEDQSNSSTVAIGRFEDRSNSSAVTIGQSGLTIGQMSGQSRSSAQHADQSNLGPASIGQSVGSDGALTLKSINSTLLPSGESDDQSVSLQNGGCNMMDNRSRVSQLERYFYSLQISTMPIYQTQKSGGKYRTLVKLPTGGTFYGSLAPNEKQAMDSVAGIALLKLGCIENQSELSRSRTNQSAESRSCFEQSHGIGSEVKRDEEGDLGRFKVDGERLEERGSDLGESRESGSCLGQLDGAPMKDIVLQNFIPTQVLKNKKVPLCVQDSNSVSSKATKTESKELAAPKPKISEPKSSPKKRNKNKSRLAANFTKPV